MTSHALTKPGSNSPFVYRFSTDRHKYLYDVNSNRVFRTDDALYAIATDYGTKNAEQIMEQHGGTFAAKDLEAAMAEIAAAQRNGLLHSHRPQKMQAIQNLEQAILEESCEQLILNITEDCNLRCAYCVHGGHYTNYRQHSKRMMSEQTAKDAVDFFLGQKPTTGGGTGGMAGGKPGGVAGAELGGGAGCGADAEPGGGTNGKTGGKAGPGKVNLAFYGGEPLVNFPLIAATVSYAKKKMADKSGTECSFSLTTNGTLLGEPDIARFLIDNQFSLTISLDGDAPTHDRYRRFTSGKGSHAVIIRNLRGLKSANVDYYRTKVTFSAINPPPYRLLSTLEFFSSDALFDGLHVTPGFLSRAENSFISAASRGGGGERDARDKRDEQVEQDEREGSLDELSRIYADKVRKGATIPPMLDGIVGKYIRWIYERPKNSLGDLPLNGCCTPGLRRQFVNIDGNIFTCEKMGETHSIGSIYTGLDVDKIRSLIDGYIEISADCLNCWACRLCPVCFATAHDGSRLSIARKLEECDAVRRRLGEMLILYYSLLENNPAVFDFYAS
jgi:uncharacterized protein